VITAISIHHCENVAIIFESPCVTIRGYRRARAVLPAGGNTPDEACFERIPSGGESCKPQKGGLFERFFEVMKYSPPDRLAGGH